MKRTGPPKRRPHPSNPHSTLARRTKPMAKKSASKKREEAETNPARKRFAASVWLCQCCGKRNGDRHPMAVHEIACGGSRTQSLKHPACWLYLCGDDPRTGHVGCHTIVQGWPRRCSMVRQLALKKYSDPGRYDRVVVLRAKGLAVTAWTEAEVDRAVSQLKAKGVESWIAYN